MGQALCARVQLGSFTWVFMLHSLSLSIYSKRGKK